MKNFMNEEDRRYYGKRSGKNGNKDVKILIEILKEKSTKFQL